LERDNRSPVCREEQQKRIFDSEYLSGGGCKAKKEKKKSFAYVFGNINCNVFIVYKKVKIENFVAIFTDKHKID
jgi:hypothetical protein